MGRTEPRLPGRCAIDGDRPLSAESDGRVVLT